MDSLSGLLLVPPDRTQILGRAAWKPRYVVIGPRSILSFKDHQNILSRSASEIIKKGVEASVKSSGKPYPDDYCISLYKSKDELEPAAQYPIGTVCDCQIQSMAYRKQGPVLPTLAISLSDKEKKRRSSRAGFMSSKDSNTTTLYFRTPPDDHHISLHEWARYILARKGPLSPDSPVSPVFSNPFSARSREASEYFSRPGSGSRSGDHRPLHHKTSTASYSTGTRERPATFSSHSPSLRSKRSDVSSSINYGTQTGFVVPGQHYTTVLPSDLPSPITSTSEYKGELIEGWTAAQGRSSTMTSSIQGRDSISSQVPRPIQESSSPPAPRETILDRAFQLKFIPGSENDVPGEDKLTSLARFDALMREVDSKRRQRMTVESSQQQRTPMRSTFEADDSSEDGSVPDKASEGDSDSDDDYYVHEQDCPQSPALIPPTTQRALEYITGRSEPKRSPDLSARPTMSRTPLSFHADQMPNPLMHIAPPVRPQTAHSRSRPSASQRSQSSPHMVAAMMQSRPEDDTSRSDKRKSMSNTKRLSSTETAQRLSSSSSSLLLVQTNASGGSSQRSSGIDERPSSISWTTLNPRGAKPPPVPPLPPFSKDLGDPARRCTWRNSVIGTTEGGFL